MVAQKYLTRALANLFFFLKKKEFGKTDLKFLVFTGTVGKTTVRDAVAYALKGLNIQVQSNRLGYTNELGIVLTAFDSPEFSLKSPRAWLWLLTKKLPKEGFICIELGADFYQDIHWFMKRFVPFAIFISGIARESWSRDIKKVFEDRQKLIEAVPQSGFIVYNLDDPGTVELIQKSNLRARPVSISLNANSAADICLDQWTKNIFTQPLTKVFENKEKIVLRATDLKVELFLPRPIFEPQVYGILAACAFIQVILPDRMSEVSKIFTNYGFSKNRLQIFKAKSGALIIEDSYKATPLCTNWFLDMAAKISARRKVLIITEMRPLTFHIEDFYLKFANKIEFAEQVYFLGPNEYFKILKKRFADAQKIEQNDYGHVAQEILSRYSEGDLILLKGSFRYQLDMLRKLLV